MKTILEREARDIAAEALRTQAGGVELVITSVRPLDIGWLVLYQSKAYVESQDVQKMLIGNAPLLVDHQGRVHQTGTALPTSTYVEEIRKSLQE